MSESQTIDVQCPHCEQMLRVPGTAGGKRILCPDCNKEMDVPFQSGITEEAPKPRSRASDYSAEELNAGFARNPEMRIFSPCPAGG